MNKTTKTLLTILALGGVGVGLWFLRKKMRKASKTIPLLSVSILLGNGG